MVPVNLYEYVQRFAFYARGINGSELGGLTRKLAYTSQPADEMRLFWADEPVLVVLFFGGGLPSDGQSVYSC